MTTATIAADSWRVDSVKPPQSFDFAADESAARRWFDYMADTGHSVELVATDGAGHTRLVDEYSP